MRYNRIFLDAIIDEVADRYDSAYQKLNRCIALNPNAAEAYYFLATLDTTSRGDSLRIERLSQAVKLSPHNDIYQERLGEAYIDAGQYDKSIEAAFKAPCRPNRRATGTASALQPAEEL